jgi:hypothetical protein
MAVSEIAEWIATLSETRTPGTLGQYLIAFRLVLDHVGFDPNPARDARVKLPKQVREEPNPPSGEHSKRSSARWGRSGGSCSSRSNRARSGSGRRSACAGLTSTPRAYAFACRSRRRSVIVRAGCTSLSGSCARWRRRALWRTACPSGKCSRASPRHPRTRRCQGRARTRRSRTTTRMTFVIAGSRSGTSRACPRANSPNAPVMRGRQCRSTSIRTSCRRTRSCPSGSCPCSRARGVNAMTTEPEQYMMWECTLATNGEWVLHGIAVEGEPVVYEVARPASPPDPDGVEMWEVLSTANRAPSWCPFRHPGGDWVVPGSSDCGADRHGGTKLVLVRIILHRAESSRSLRGNVRRVWELESDGYAAWLRSGVDW